MHKLLKNKTKCLKSLSSKLAAILLGTLLAPNFSAGASPKPNQAVHKASTKPASMSSIQKLVATRYTETIHKETTYMTIPIRWHGVVTAFGARQIQYSFANSLQEAKIGRVELALFIDGYEKPPYEIKVDADEILLGDLDFFSAISPGRKQAISFESAKPSKTVVTSIQKRVETGYSEKGSEETTYFTTPINWHGVLIPECGVRRIQYTTAPSNQEGTLGHAELALFVDGYEKPPYEMSIYTNKILFKNPDFFSAISYGCCAAPDREQLISFESAKPFISSDIEVLQITVPNTKQKRFIAYHGVSYTESFAAGALEFSDIQGVKQEVTIRMKNSRDFDHLTPMMPDLKLRFNNKKDGSRDSHKDQFELRSKSGQNSPTSFTDFDIVMTYEFYDPKTFDGAKVDLVLPVKDGFIMGNKAAKFDVFMQAPVEYPIKNSQLSPTASP